jgi:hypothetical protein
MPLISSETARKLRKRMARYIGPSPEQLTPPSLQPAAVLVVVRTIGAAAGCYSTPGAASLASSRVPFGLDNPRETVPQDNQMS